MGRYKTILTGNNQVFGEVNIKRGTFHRDTLFALSILLTDPIIYDSRNGMLISTGKTLHKDQPLNIHGSKAIGESMDLKL